MTDTAKHHLPLYLVLICIRVLTVFMIASTIIFGIINILPSTYFQTIFKSQTPTVRNKQKTKISDEFPSAFRVPASFITDESEEIYTEGITAEGNTAAANTTMMFSTNVKEGTAIQPTTASQQYIKAIGTHPLDEACHKRLPQAIVVGIQKCGTAALLFFLNEHPQIAALMNPGEPKFFSLFYNRGLEWYRQLMKYSFSNQITIEKSPPYYFRPFTADLIHKMNPDTKIIITVKDPVIRSLSMYAMLKEDDANMPTFENIVSNCTNGKIKGNHVVIKWSIYANYIIPWIRTFGLDQIHFVDGQNLETNPSEELNKIEKYLNIGSYFTSDNFVFNKTKGKQCLQTGDAQGDMFCMVKNKGRAHPVISKSLTSRLQNYFRPVNARFFNIIGQTFDWGY